jgi:hypothetical protein
VIHIIRVLFSWPDGIVLGNLLASAMWAAPALIHLHRKMNRHHARLLAAISQHPAGKKVSA